MDIVLKNVKKKDFSVLKSLAKALKFEIVINEDQTKEKPYNPEFVKEILEASKEIREGKGIRVTMEELEQLCK